MLQVNIRETACFQNRSVASTTEWRPAWRTTWMGKHTLVSRLAALSRGVLSDAAKIELLTVLGNVAIVLEIRFAVQLQICMQVLNRKSLYS